MNLPRHSGHDDEAPQQASPSRTRTLLVIVSLVAIVVVIVVLHVTGVISGH
jgi:hypothetical protein